MIGTRTDTLHTAAVFDSSTRTEKLSGSIINNEPVNSNTHELVSHLKYRLIDLQRLDEHFLTREIQQKEHGRLRFEKHRLETILLKMSLCKESGCVLMAVCLFAMVEALIFDNVGKYDSTEDESKTAEQYVKMAAFRMLGKVVRVIEEPIVGDCFQCSGLTCTCYTGITVYAINVTCSITVTYLPKTQRMILEVVAKDTTVINEEYPVSVSKTVCRKGFWTVVFCLEMFQVHVKIGAFIGCAKLTVNGEVQVQPECFIMTIPNPPVPR